MDAPKIPTRVTYLEIPAPIPTRSFVPPFDGIEVRQARRPTVAFYRFLYSEAGRQYSWTARLLMPTEDLREIIENPRVEVHVLYLNGVPAGYVELDGRVSGQVEIAYFGIFPEFQGRKLGPFLLDWAIGSVAACSEVFRLWVHTCTLDHPSALKTYLKAGFEIFDERDELVDPPSATPGKFV